MFLSSRSLSAMLHLSSVITFLIFYILRAPLVAAGVPSNYPKSVRTVFQFDNGTWVENIAIRSNGNILVTLIDRPELFQIDPFHNTARLLTNLEEEADALSLLGIAELAPDVFVFVAGNFSISRGASDPASYSVWQIDFNRGGRCEKITGIERLPEASFLNGMTVLNHKEGLVLISDSVQGLVWRLNRWTGKYDAVLGDDTMRPAEGVPLVLGITGLTSLEDHLYYASALKGLFCRVLIDTSTGSALGPYEIIAVDVPGDDFTMSLDGAAFVTETGENSLE